MGSRVALRIRAPRSAGLASLAALALVALAGALVHAQPVAPGWSLEQISPADKGVVGARSPALSAVGDDLAFPHDGDLVPAGAGNADGNRELFDWRSGTFTQVTRTSRQGGTTPTQSEPSLSRDGSRVAFVSTADLTGGNPDGSAEVFVWQLATGFIQVTSADTGAAEGPSLSADGDWVFFWHTGDLAGDNPSGALQLFRARVGGPELDQLTRLSGVPHHEAPSTNGDGSAAAFIVEADLSGANADGSWEIYLWRGPASTPGDPARFQQITDWRPPLTGREIYSASLDDAADRVAFAARGEVDVRLPDGHQELEIYLWEAPDVLRRLTTATRTGASSLLPRIAGSGQAITFVSISDFAPGAPGNEDRDQELFVWSWCRPIEQVTDSVGRSAVVANVPELRPAVDHGGRVAALVSEKADDVGPLALSSRLGILFRAAADDTGPCVAPTVTPGTPPPTRTPTSAATPSTQPPTPTAPAATPSTPPPTVTVPPATPPAGQGNVCPQVATRIPAAVQAWALANPDQVYGWTLPQNPALPPGRRNPPRRWLSLRDVGKPYGPGNPVVWKVGCP